MVIGGLCDIGGAHGSANALLKGAWRQDHDENTRTEHRNQTATSLFHDVPPVVELKQQCKPGNYSGSENQRPECIHVCISFRLGLPLQMGSESSFQQIGTPTKRAK